MVMGKQEKELQDLKRNRTLHKGEVRHVYNEDDYLNAMLELVKVIKGEGSPVDLQYYCRRLQAKYMR